MKIKVIILSIAGVDMISQDVDEILHFTAAMIGNVM